MSEDEIQYIVEEELPTSETSQECNTIVVSIPKCALVVEIPGLITDDDIRGAETGVQRIIYDVTRILA